jgi:hypothetical protein
LSDRAINDLLVFQQEEEIRSLGGWFWCKAKRVSIDIVGGEWFAYLVLVLLVVGRRLGQIYLDLLYRFDISSPSPFALHCQPRIPSPSETK